MALILAAFQNSERDWATLYVLRGVRISGLAGEISPRRRESGNKMATECRGGAMSSEGGKWNGVPAIRFLDKP